jgi:hypothetical protein
MRLVRHKHLLQGAEPDKEYQRQLEEASRQSQADYTWKLEEDNRFYSAQWDAIHHLYPSQASGPGGPSRRFDETDSDSDSK